MIEKIIELILEISPYEEVDAESELIESGILDSMSVLVLVTEIEDSFDVVMPDDSVTKENFSRVSRIAKLIEKMKSKGT